MADFLYGFGTAVALVLIFLILRKLKKKLKERQLDDLLRRRFSDSGY